MRKSNLFLKDAMTCGKPTPAATCAFCWTGNSRYIELVLCFILIATYMLPDSIGRRYRRSCIIVGRFGHRTAGIEHIHEFEILYLSKCAGLELQLLLPGARQTRKQVCSLLNCRMAAGNW